MNENDPNEHTHSDIADNNELVGDEQDMRKKLPEHWATRGRRLEFARKARDLTQTKLAEAVGVTQSAISRYEADQDLPAGDVLLAILETLEIRWKWLKSGDEPMQEPIYDRDVKDIADRLQAADPGDRAELVRWFNRLTRPK